MHLPIPANNSRIGFYYYPDTTHYRENDLNTWLPELFNLGASWVTLPAPLDRAIPEHFLKGLLSCSIEPVLHLVQPLNNPLHVDQVRILFESYQSWGVHFVAIFDRPNIHRSWSAAQWSQSNLVERFLDLYLPIADCARQTGLIPVFPPLEPAGDYWDIAFLRQALQGIERRGYFHLLDPLVLGAYAWPGNRSLNWGAGGPERWPGARPYCPSPDGEDQCGFRIYDWYQAIIRAELNQSGFFLLLGAGCRPGDHQDSHLPSINEVTHSQRNLDIARLMTTPEITYKEDQSIHPAPHEVLEPVPTEVLACNFWLLAASNRNSHSKSAWFQPGGHSLPIVSSLRQWVVEQKINGCKPYPPGHYSGVLEPTSSHLPTRPIAHYLLLPSSNEEMVNWQLEFIRPFILKNRPTIGFSLSEAMHAERVTLVGGNESFTASSIAKLRTAGCQVQQVSGDGTTIATQLASM